jgi:aminomethyltransferase
MLNDDGGVVDDLIAYFLDDTHYRLVANAATRTQDLGWINAQSSGFIVEISERPELAMIAIQGPAARARVATLLPELIGRAVLALKPFHALDAGELFIARTGYTGEDGLEIVLPESTAAAWWRRLVDAGVRLCGLGARDTLRLEAGMNLYGTDMDQSTSPLESGLGWTIAWDPVERQFIGRDALQSVRDKPSRKRFSGLLLQGRGVLRNHLRVLVEGRDAGEITSGGFSPTLNRSIAMARLPSGNYDRAQVDVRGKLLEVRLVKPPFVRNGKICIDL